MEERVECVVLQEDEEARKGPSLMLSKIPLIAPESSVAEPLIYPPKKKET